MREGGGGQWEDMYTSNTLIKMIKKRKEGRKGSESERKRNISVREGTSISCLLHAALPGIEPATCTPLIFYPVPHADLQPLITSSGSNEVTYAKDFVDSESVHTVKQTDLLIRKHPF